MTTAAGNLQSSSTTITHTCSYTKYYPPEQHAWLSEVQDYHIRVKLQVVHNSTGAILVEADASPTMYHHPERYE